MLDQTPWRELGYNQERRHSLVAPFLPEIQVAVGQENQVIGFLRWSPDAFLGQPYLKLLAVAPEHGRRGVGRALLAWLETEVFQHRRAANLFLCVSDFNQPARQFYQALGYREVGVLASYLRTGKDEVLLRKSVRPLLETDL
jgi:ribosomal protein S18 acetylase RimI-like enzyme